MIKTEAAGITVTQNSGDFFQAGMKSPPFPFKYIKKIVKFDPFGDDFYCYTFRNMCDELKDKPLDDGTCKLFFITAGYIGDTPSWLKELLNYMNDTQAYPVEESKNDLIRKLDVAVNETKMKPIWRDAFMISDEIGR